MARNGELSGVLSDDQNRIVQRARHEPDLNDLRRPADTVSVVITGISWVLGLAGGLLVLFLLTPPGTETDDETTFSGEERRFMLKAAGVLLALVILMRAVGIDEDTAAGRVVLGPVGFPIMFLLFMAAFGGVSHDA